MTKKSLLYVTSFIKLTFQEKKPVLKIIQRVVIITLKAISIFFNINTNKKKKREPEDEL